MRKIAVFVEGQTELIFVRELLLHCYQWQNVHIECSSLFKDLNFIPVDYAYKASNARIYYEIFNVGNDTKVLQSILRHEEYMYNQQFSKIIGLRDMYSRDYKKAASGSKIDLSINQQFIDGTQETINREAVQPDKIKFHYAIMEMEAWFLGIKDLFPRLDERLTTKQIAAGLDLNLEELDPETTFFQPAKVVDRIFQLIQQSYKKKKDEVERLATQIAKEDYESLYEEDKCAAFNAFYEALEINSEE